MIKDLIFPLFRGSGDQNKIFIKKKKWGRILVPAVGLGEEYWVGV